MTMLPVTRAPVSFRDPLYEQLARAAEGKFGLPAGILDAIRLFGERSNANQVSSAGGQGVYQFIPPTRRGMMKNYGVDPYKDPSSETDAAALHLLESFGRTHNWDKAIAGYHGGIKAERGIRGPQNRAYTGRVGSFDGEESMPSLYPPQYYGRDPLAPLEPTAMPERPQTNVPIPGDLGPSAPAPATSPTVARKRGGIMGALESVFMPEPDTPWGAALRYGLFNAKAGLRQERLQQQANQIGLETANIKLKNLKSKGEYQIAGNNLIHFAPDGTAEFITPPQTPGERERLIDKWEKAPTPEVKEMIERVLSGANADEVLAAKAAASLEAARIRAGATTGAARIRSETPSKTSDKLPPNFILDQ